MQPLRVNDEDKWPNEKEKESLNMTMVSTQ